jgi:2-desacetyl-2-hydroxyethyl bacteriochlorophyllide A dehydrogenase
VNRRAVVFTGPRRVEVVEEPLEAPPAGHLLVRAAVSAISGGTELLAFRGHIPAELPLDDTLAALEGRTFAHPFRFGYSSVGTVLAVGQGADPAWVGRTVFAFHPHASAFVVPAADVVAVPEGLPPERAALLASMETAVNLVLDGRPLLGERVVVIGQGVVGLLATALLARFPLESLTVIEAQPLRARAARALGAHAALAPGEALPVGRADLVYELSGDPAALDTALAVAGREARVIIGSWYGAKRAPVDLGGAFHRGRISIASSQVSRINPALSARWDRARRFGAAWRALGEIDTGPLVTHRFPLTEAQQAYETLDRSPDRALQVLLSPPA